MIDCSRLMERHDYYFKLLDFMAEWKMNTLLFHFSDDHGLGIALKGFKKLAMKNAFTLDEMKKLIDHAKKRNIEIIPELETFGHTRFITDHPDYKHLYAGKKTKKLSSNAIDPLNPESLKLITKMLKATAELFPGKYLHIGCDEVEMTEYCKNRNLNVVNTWTDYVNQIISIAVKLRRIPMMWGDHISNDPKIAAKLRKDVVVLDWRYHKGLKATVSTKLAKNGFEKIIGAPSLACYAYRFSPSDITFRNTIQMSRLAAKYDYAGIINTIWCPYRYFQEALYYGIAFSAESVRGKGKVDLDKFQTKFSEKVFGTELKPDLRKFLQQMPKLEINYEMADKLALRKNDFSETEIAEFEKINQAGKKAIKAAFNYKPKKNTQIFKAMLLSAKSAWLCSEFVLLKNQKANPKRKKTFKALLCEVRKKASEEWDRTRCPKSPQKNKPLFPYQDGNYALLILKGISKSVR